MTCHKVVYSHQPYSTSIPTTSRSTTVPRASSTQMIYVSRPSTNHSSRLKKQLKRHWMHQTDTSCSWLVCHSRGDCRGEHCVNCIHLPRLSGGPAAKFFWEVSRASPQHGWRSAYSLRETLSPTQDQNQH